MMHVILLSFVGESGVELKQHKRQLFMLCLICLMKMRRMGGDSHDRCFNSINHQVALWNLHVIWPSCSLFIFNIYRRWAPLVVTDLNEYLYSKGITQGDPLSMFVYAVATLPLIECIGHPNAGRDVWYADDASACAPLWSHSHHQSSTTGWSGW